MQNDKNFILFIVVTVLVLFLYPKIVQVVAPQLIENKTRLRHEIIPESPEPVEQALVPDEKTPKYTEILSAEEKSYDLESSLYQLRVRAPYGEITRIVLKNYIDPKTSRGTVLIDVPPEQPGILRDSGFGNDFSVQSVDTGADSMVIVYKNPQNMRLKKTLKLGDQQYVFTVSYEIINEDSSPQDIVIKTVTASGWHIAEQMDTRTTERVTYLTDLKKLYKKPLTAKAEPIQGEISFTGIKGRYFSLLISPDGGARRVNIRHTGPVESGAVIMEMSGQPVTVPAGGSMRQEIFVFAGPNRAEVLNRLGRDFQEILGRGVGAAVSEVVLLVLRVFYNLCHNYGLALILLSLLINSLLAPLSVQSYKSMKAMQQLQPMVEKLRTEYKDNPQRLNKEIMELYRKQQINPAGGCLPLLLQIPVFWALFNVLQQVVELRGASFLWIKDLSGPDALFSIEALRNIPLIGGFTQGNINILPILMCVIQSLQQKLTQPNMAQSNEQQKMMAVMMPLMMGILFYGFPSGLMLYFLTNSLFSCAVQWKISRAQ
ncbi:MAG: membrane protein insertase YidC [Candidatus Omnitrophica bacterium]|nr:membrane protein insertase YidC [Candidatus Omnitrophota bacterium]